jgi:hypothetical protein
MSSRHVIFVSIHHQQTIIIMPRPTEEEVRSYIENVIDVEETFPSPNREHAVKAFYEKFFPETEFEDDISLRPGDQFCLNQDGSAMINRADGRTEEFYPEDGWVSIRIDV